MRVIFTFAFDLYHDEDKYDNEEWKLKCEK